MISRDGPPEGKPVKLQLPGAVPGIARAHWRDNAAAGVRVRDLTLNEAIDALRTLDAVARERTSPTGPGAFGLAYESAPTETPAIGDVEVWRIFNLSADAHPIHFHLVNVQILSRQAFSRDVITACLSSSALPVPPDANELGWKETVRMNPGECTTVIMQFNLPVVKDWRNPLETIPVPSSPRTGGHEYVWHCHILEHEEHDMMRPLIVG